MSFQISALDQDQFSHLFALSDEELANLSARRITVDKKPGFPCRVSLQDAEVGEQVILLNYEHLAVPTPFQSKYAIYVRPAANTVHPGVGQVPEVFQQRIMSMRGFSKDGMLLAADLSEGSDLAPAIERLFSDQHVAFIHLHFAKPGCYAARVDRVPASMERSSQ
jgi:hypothetical protein